MESVKDLLVELDEKLKRHSETVALTESMHRTAAETLYLAQAEVLATQEILAHTRSAAVATEQIQQKEHGTNAKLRDAHEADFLRNEIQAVEIAQLAEKQARFSFDQVGRELSAIRMQIRLTQARVSIGLALLELDKE